MIGIWPRGAMVPCLTGTLAVLALGSASAHAQTVRGEVVEESGGSPVSSATVLLLDADGRRVAGAFTDERGRFALRAAAPGTLRVRVLRIGFRSTESPPLTLGAGEVRDVRLVAGTLPTQLAEVRITEQTRCESRPGEGEVVGQLWEEVRKALLATVIAQETRLVRVRLSYYERDLHPVTLRPAPEHRWAMEGVTSNPFVTLPPEQLARRGFVHREGDFNVYYGPDARLLLSDEFLAGHCLRAVPASKDAPGLVGIGFEPQGRGNLPDVKGTLWLDEKTFELRHLDFDYVRLAETLPPGRAGGRVEFGRLPSGAWIVQRWYIRMPQMRERQSSDGLPPGGASASALRSVARII
ncbi:MAG: carboxypeptidase-like regulatory domain-containing protein, partial [Gemmatimonadaceae bacterium]